MMMACQDLSACFRAGVGTAGTHSPSFRRNLFVQADNASGECKNKFFIGSMAALVHLGLFAEVEIWFMLEYHTHEDVDQMFSNPKRRLYHINTNTLPEWLGKYARCFTPAERPHMQMLPFVADFKVRLLA
jgi:proteasome lid subunit RPN8/RPN11